MKAHKSFIFFLVFFTALHLASVNVYSQAPCPDPVKVAEDNSLFITIQEAYDYSSSNWTDFTLLLASETFNEDLIIDGGSVLFDGGYECTFSTKNLPTGILGSITISAGAVTFDNIALLSPPACAFDSDGDGFTSIGSCTGSADDCDDNNPNTFPGAIEICDSQDNNCDGQIDEGLSSVDADGDGYSAIGSCGGTADDCNDNNANINPGAAEILGDGIDQDCDGQDLINSYENDCFGCHGGVSVINNSLHQSVAAPDGTCAACHAAKVSAVLPGHYGETVKTAGNNMTAGSTIVCISCHDWHEPGEYDVGNANIVWSKVAATWNGSTYVNLTCDTCHENRAALHGASAHQVEVGGDLSNGVSCDVCHAVANWSEIEGVHNVATNGAGSCATCHNSPRTEVQITISNGVPPHYCLECHSDKAAAHGSHDATVFVWTASCGTASCHNEAGNANISTTVHNGCTTCHATTAGGLGTTIVGSSANGIDGNAQLAAGPGYATSSCLTCHPTGTYSWEAVHTTTATAVDHSTSVADLSTCTTSCHTGTGGNTQIATNNGTTRAADMIHDDCADCHETTGLLKGPYGYASAITAGNCGDCHGGGSDYFDSHEHGTDTGYVSHNLSHNTVTDLSQPAPGSACYNCHDDAGLGKGTSALSTWDAIKNEHSTVNGSVVNPCSTCHSYTTNQSGNPNTPDPSVVSGLIPSASVVECLGCHIPKATPATHGGHAATDFAWVAATQTSCGSAAKAGTYTVSTCHDYANNQNVIVDVHNDNCANCHVDPDNGDYTRRSGPNGSAEDGTLTSTCTDCHAADVHTHTTKGWIVEETACSMCHAKRVWDSSMVDPDRWLLMGFNEQMATGPHAYFRYHVCATCHVEPNGGGPLIPAVEAVAPNGGTCRACHNFSITMPNTTWHGDTASSAAFVHQHLEGPSGHTLPTGASINCADCHDGVLGQGPISTAEERLSLHMADPNDMDSCLVCHVTYDSISPTNIVYTNYDLVPSLAYTKVETTVISGWAGSGSSVSCEACHDLAANEGPLADGARHHNIVGGSAQSGACNDCHTSTDHTRIAIDAVNDIAQTNNQPCDNCHGVSDGQGGFNLAGWSDILFEHTMSNNGCDTCHFYTDEGSGTPDATTNLNTIMTPPASVDCLTCHVPKTAPAGHGGHDPADFGWSPSCSASACHNEAGNSDIVASPDVHDNECGLCHVSPSGGGTLRSYAVGKTISESTTCATCHGSDVQTVHPNCNTCHGEPPDGTSPPNTEGAHADHAALGYGSVNPSCGACHDGATHYSGTVDTDILANFNAQSGSASTNGSTCSSTRCHGGQTTPDWLTGSIDVNTDCTSCHDQRNRGSIPNQYNDLYSGEHDKHVRGEGYACTVCHNTSTLAPGHFINLETSAFEQNPASTVGGGTTSVPSGYSGTCNFTCHGKDHQNENW